MANVADGAREHIERTHRANTSEMHGISLRSHFDHSLAMRRAAIARTSSQSQLHRRVAPSSLYLHHTSHRLPTPSSSQTPCLDSIDLLRNPPRFHCEMPSLSLPSTPRSRVALAIFLAGGSGAAVISRLSALLRRCRLEQQSLTAIALGADAAKVNSQQAVTEKKEPRIAVDARFLKRLLAILRVCIPGIASREALLVFIQGILLFSRTLLSDRITHLEGICAENVTAQNWIGFRRVLLGFALNSIPAAIVNSALKAIQVLVSLAFRTRLTKFLHKAYMGNRAYYAASVLSGLSHSDQRITDDVEKFCETVAELYSHTFKPLLDVLVFSRSLARIIGYKGQIGLYAYFIVVGAFLRRISPPLGKMTAEFASLSADLRTAHHRISTSAEEVAFNDPPAGRAEMLSLNTRLDRLVRHSRLTVVQRFVQQCFDGYLVKYTASIIGLVIFAVPLYYTPISERAATNVLAGQYINSMRLMMQTSAAMGQLVLVYKRINTLAGHTARVSELIEKVKELGKPQGHLDAFRRIQNRVEEAKGDDERAGVNNRDNISQAAKRWPARRSNGKHIMLENVSMWSPDGTALVQELSFEVPQGTSVIILGPNGSGKSSVLRMLAGLWPLQAGTVTLPARDDMFYLSQRPYTFSGTLKEQLMYPRLPGVVIGDNVKFDERAATSCLESVELSHLIVRCRGFDGKLAWDETLSGGERNRLAVARLLYHKPRFAVLDECTAAVSADGEVVLYKAMADAGITMLSVAHRKAVMEFHQASVVMDGAGGWEIKPLNAEEMPLLPNGM